MAAEDGPSTQEVEDSQDNFQACIERSKHSYDELSLVIFNNSKKKEQIKIKATADDLFDSLLNLVDSKPCSLKVTAADYKDVIQNVVNLEFLTKLELSDIDMKKIGLDSDLEFGHLASLEDLILNNTNIRHLHPSIGRLQNLTSLSLACNRLYDLPVTIRLLRNLICIDITNNLFRSLPGALYHMLNLKTIVGLNDNLLEVNPAWCKDNLFIHISRPLVGSAVVRESVESLQSLAAYYAIGTDVWSVQLPPKHMTEIIKRTVFYDLCEICRKPVRRITSYQETDGFMFKVCLVLFNGVRNVPFKFFVCSFECRYKLIDKLNHIQRLNIDNLSSCDQNSLVPEVTLKNSHCKLKTTQSFYNQREMRVEPPPTTSQAKNRCTIF